MLFGVCGVTMSSCCGCDLQNLLRNNNIQMAALKQSCIGSWATPVTVYCREGLRHASP